jgi:hypothetical protein
MKTKIQVGDTVLDHSGNPFTVTSINYEYTGKKGKPKANYTVSDGELSSVVHRRDIKKVIKHTEQTPVVEE